MENTFIFFVGLVSFLQVSQTMIYFQFDIFTIHPCRFFICQTLSKFLLPSLGRIFGSRIKSSEGEFREPSLTTGFRKGCKQLLFLASLLDIKLILSNQMICESKFLRAQKFAHANPNSQPCLFFVSQSPIFLDLKRIFSKQGLNSHSPALLFASPLLVASHPFLESSFSSLSKAGFPSLHCQKQVFICFAKTSLRYRCLKGIALSF